MRMISDMLVCQYPISVIFGTPTKRPIKNVPNIKRPKYKTSQDITFQLQNANYKRPQLQNDPSLKTSQLQKATNTKRPQLQISQAS